MITECAVEIEAPANVVWDVFSDVERWPEWTSSVTRLTALDGSELAIGKRYELKQPRMPKLIWVVTEISPGTGWSWEQRSPGGLTVARHEIAPVTDRRTRVRQQVDQRGPVGVAVAVLMHRMTKRYLDLEAAGLKTRSEQLYRLDGAAS
ncbi:SRPBCC family protein [Mycolicibacterium sp. XJ879]